MYCPNCGKADQKENTYCRRCGTFLPDFDKIKKRETPPEMHLKANTVLNVMSGIASVSLAILLYIFFLGRSDTPLIIYVTAGFLTAMFFWQAQVFWRNLQLKKQIPKRVEAKENSEDQIKIESAKTKELLSEAEFGDMVPADAATRATKNFSNR